MKRLVALLVVALAGPVAAQVPAHAPPPVPPLAQEPPASRTPEPLVQVTVIEDDRGARIEELRVRGEVKRIQVQTRSGSTYHVVPADGARDVSQGASSGRGTAGKGLWSVLSF